MIPILYEKDETEFLTEGIGRLPDTMGDSYITEERNGVYELEMDYPVDGQYSKELTENRLILAKPCIGGRNQPFRIAKINANDLKTKRIYATHISYQLLDIPVKPFVAYNVKEAMSKLKENAGIPIPFTFSADWDTTEGVFELKEPTNIRTAIGGMEGSIIDTWGGEIEWDMFNVILHKERGTDNNVFVRYGKNLLGVNYESNTEDYYTAIYPYFYKENNQDEPPTVVLPESVYDLGVDTTPTLRKVFMLNTADLYEDHEFVPSVADLNQAAADYAKENILDAISRSIDVDYLDLSRTTDYSGKENLEQVGLCDQINVQFTKMNINLKSKIYITQFDFRKEKYNALTIGTAKQTVSSAIGKLVTNIVGKG